MKKYEKGSLMIEILAVLALISLITPMLFKQVSRRNEEVTRINVATEMRSIKDAMSAYIQTYEEKIASKLGLQDGSGNYTSAVSAKFEKLSEAEINELVGGFLIGNSGADYLHPEKGDYVLYFYGYTVPVYVDTQGVQLPASGDSHRPVIVGIVLQKEGNDRLSTASRTASLIGSEGGVVDREGHITGIGEAWGLDLNGAEKYAVAAVTAFDADSNSKLLDNLKIKDFHGETASATQMAAERFHALQFLSVGPKDIANNSCLTGYGQTGMAIAGRGETLSGGAVSEACEPLFEVNGTTGEVFIKGAILTSEEVPDSLKEVAKDNSGTIIQCSDVRPCPAGLVCENGQCVYSHYSLDPAYTSVMNDIKVMSRGGARLSEILPNYISKNIQVVNVSSSDGSVDAPKCPNGYVQAIVVQPTSTELGKATLTDVKLSETVTVHRVEKQDDHMIIRIVPDVGTEKSEVGFMTSKVDKPVKTWSISAEFVATGETTGRRSNTYLVAHTYCVFDPDNFDIPDKNRTK